MPTKKRQKSKSKKWCLAVSHFNMPLFVGIQSTAAYREDGSWGGGPWMLPLRLRVFWSLGSVSTCAYGRHTGQFLILGGKKAPVLHVIHEVFCLLTSAQAAEESGTVISTLMLEVWTSARRICSGFRLHSSLSCFFRPVYFSSMFNLRP